MKSCNRRASGLTTETGSIVGGGAIRVKAVGSGHAEAVVGVPVACLGGGDGSVIFQTVASPMASWWVGCTRQFLRRRVTQPQTYRRRLARCFV